MDRLSELDDTLLTEILSLLEMRDVVRTGILSKRWKNVWTTVPCLNFDDPQRIDGYVPQRVSIVETEKFRKFVNGAIKSWRGKKLVKLVIRIKYIRFNIIPSRWYSDFNFWVRFAVENKVEELHIGFNAWVAELLPQCLYSCSFLKVLSLQGCTYQINPKINVQWNQLKSLKIRALDMRSAKGIEQMLRNSPQLEEFILHIGCIHDKLSIRSNSLKTLRLVNLCSDTRLYELEIWTPNLETLEILKEPTGMFTCTVKDVPSSTHVAIDFDVRPFTKTSLRHILPAIQHVESLTLTRKCIEGLGTMENILVKMNVKLLELKNIDSDHDVEMIVRTLENFPQLQMLVLQVETLRLKATESPHLPYSSFLLELRTVEIAWTNGVDKSVFPLIKMLLKYATNLQKMVFRDNAPLLPRKRDRTSIPISLSSVSKELLGMPRSSPTAELLFCI